MARKAGSKQVPDERKRCIIEMRKAGMKVGLIAKHYRMHHSTVSNIIRRYNSASTTATMKKRGRKFTLTARALRLFRNYVVQNCFDPLYVIVAKFSATTGIQMCERTGQRYIKRLRMCSYVAVQKPFKTPQHLLSRLQWARKHEAWTDDEWKHVMFTDESTFTVRPASNRLRVWRKQGERWMQRHTVPTFKSGYQTVSVWGGFSKLGRTPLVGIVGHFNQFTYRSIIDAHVLPFKENVHNNNSLFTLQEDNCGPHRAKSIATYLHYKQVNRMKWPSQSPDLNPIEDLWGIMKNRLRKRAVPPSNPLHLFRVLSEIWYSIPDAHLQNLVSSMVKRVTMVKNFKGGSTKY